jgi:hypothetical protein
MGGKHPALSVALAAALWCCPSPAGAVPIKEPEPEPDFVHGVGQVVAGVFLELPLTTLEATLNSPPVLGTMVGLFAGTAKALQTTAAGLVEMSAGFKPWGSKPKRR